MRVRCCLTATLTTETIIVYPTSYQRGSIFSERNTTILMTNAVAFQVANCIVMIDFIWLIDILVSLDRINLLCKANLIFQLSSYLFVCFLECLLFFRQLIQLIDNQNNLGLSFTFCFVQICEIVSEHLAPLLKCQEEFLQRQRCVFKLQKHILEHRLLESLFCNGVLCILASLLFSEDEVERIVYADKRYCLAFGKSKTVIQRSMNKGHISRSCAVSIDNHNLL